MSSEFLPNWIQGEVKTTIVDFVEKVSGPDGVPVDERVAVFDNDGTLWCEKPMPIQLDFILRRFAQMAAANPELAHTQPWKAVVGHDLEWFGSVMEAHYAGDDTEVETLASGILAAYAGISVEEFEAGADAFLRTTQHPTLGRGYLQCAYVPMIELLGYLSAHGFTNYIASGGGRDFMRPISREVYDIPRERVIGSSASLAYASDDHGGTVTHRPHLDYLDDGPEKPIRIWNRTGRRPLLAAGNSNGDIQMLEFARHDHHPTLQLLVAHDDYEREFRYTGGAELAMKRAESDGWTTISIKNDWATVF